MTPANRLLALCLVFASTSALAQGPYADHLAAKKSIKDAAEQGGVPVYEHTLPNGQTRLALNPHDFQQLATVTQELNRGGDVLEILQHKGVNHTKAIFDRELVHTQMLMGTGNWRLRPWGHSLQLSDHTLYSALIHLSPSEGQRLRGLLTAAYAEEGPEYAAGDRWEKGHLGQSMGRRFLNCVSTWTEMPVGDHGEPLWQLLGLPQSYSGNPTGLQRALETEGNHKILGTVVYGPEVAGFGQNPSARLVI